MSKSTFGDEPVKKASTFGDEPVGEPSWMDKAKSAASSIYDVVTGESESAKLPESVRNLPEMMSITDPVSTGEMGKDLQIAAGMLFSFSPEARKDVIKNAVPDAKIEEVDGTTVVTFPNGEKSVLNKAGLSYSDLAPLAAQIPIFIGTAGFGGFLSNMAARLGFEGAASAATEYGIQKTSQALGSEQDIDKSSVAIAGVGGAGGQALAETLPKVFSLFRNVEELPVSQQAKEAIKNVEKQAMEYQSQYGEAMPERQVIQLLESNGIPLDAAEKLARFSPDTNVEQVLQQSKQAATQAEQQYRIPLSEGERSGAPEMLQFEESALRGAQTPEARMKAEALKARQEAAIPQAVRTEAERLAPTPMPATSGEAVEGAIGGVKSSAENFMAQVDEAYKAIPEGSRLTPQGALQVITGMQRAASGRFFDRSLPSTTKALNDLSGFKKIMEVRAKQGKKGVPIEEMEVYRRKLNGYIESAESTDKRQLILMKQAFDEYQDKAVAEGLLTGDQGTLDAMKKARALRRQYSELFEPQVKSTRAGIKDRDSAGVLINKMAELEPSSDEVVNALFASGNAFGKKGSAQLANRMKTVLGEDSPEWQQLRQAAFLRIFGLDKGQLVDSASGKVYVSGQGTLTRLQEVIGGRGNNLAKEMFTKEEIDSMIQLARAIKRAQPAPFNPSGTASMNQFIKQSGQGKVSKMAESLANKFGILDPTTFAALKITQKGTASLGDNQVNALANQVFSGKPLQKITPNVGAEVVGASVPVMTKTSQQ